MMISAAEAVMITREDNASAPRGPGESKPDIRRYHPDHQATRCMLEPHALPPPSTPIASG
jgi:hypothetical protein